MTSSRHRRRQLLVLSLLVAAGCSETGMQNPNQPLPPPAGGNPAPATKGVKGGPKHLGSATVGVFRAEEATFLLRNTNADGEADVKFAFGAKDDLPVAGDWNSDGTVTV